MDNVSDILLGEEARRMKRGESIHLEANIIKNWGRNKTRRRRKSRDMHQSRGRSKSRSKITCYYCGRMGHKKMKCRSFKRDQKADNVKLDQINPTKKQKENNNAAVVSKEDLLYLVDEGNILNITYNDSSWIFDYGASFYVTPHGSFFSSYRSDVRLVLTMRLILISAGKLDDTEAIMAVVDIINFTPSVPLNGGILEEVWTGKRASYNHLKLFGCRAFVHIPEDERAKLDAKTKEFIYLRSPKDEFGYQLWDPVNKKSRDDPREIEDHLLGIIHMGTLCSLMRGSLKAIKKQSMIVIKKSGEESWQEEMQSLHENHTYDLLELPKGKRALKIKWVYRIKIKWSYHGKDFIHPNGHWLSNRERFGD
ncbi:hypothetical protein F3Y22_tig00111774pilonHSYRG00058 [Hibiscus syriacus]|uniref:CCHC-type domain-containing protein n=1 Tax=Hibiscus syriacus TaxID=106335 RepID=A0A6A2XED0_HIBSY|nr:hypothetical protein F3Y22_tig00111774pilonHSYRG00058 [Hibiscus syriacus]